MSLSGDRQWSVAKSCIQHSVNSGWDWKNNMYSTVKAINGIATFNHGMELYVLTDNNILVTIIEITSDISTYPIATKITFPAQVSPVPVPKTNSLVCPEDGSYVLIIATTTSTPSTPSTQSVWKGTTTATSSDQTWSQVLSTTTQQPLGNIALSSNGKYVFIATMNGVYISMDSAKTFALTTINNQVSTSIVALEPIVTCSASGQSYAWCWKNVIYVIPSFGAAHTACVCPYAITNAVMITENNVGVLMIQGTPPSSATTFAVIQNGNIISSTLLSQQYTSLAGSYDGKRWTIVDSSQNVLISYTASDVTSTNSIVTSSTTTALAVSAEINSYAFNVTSDYRIKKDAKPMGSGKYTVDGLNPVTYFNKKTEKKDFGLLAHELQDIYPFLVQGEKDGNMLQHVNYNALVALLIHEIQHLKQIVYGLCPPPPEEEEDAMTDM